MKTYNHSAPGYKRAGENLAKALAASLPTAAAIFVRSSQLGNGATVLVDGRCITLTGKQIDGALGIDFFAAAPKADGYEGVR